MCRFVWEPAASGGRCILYNPDGTVKVEFMVHNQVPLMCTAANLTELLTGVVQNEELCEEFLGTMMTEMNVEKMPTVQEQEFEENLADVLMEEIAERADVMQQGMTKDLSIGDLINGIK